MIPSAGIPLQNLKVSHLPAFFWQLWLKFSFSWVDPGVQLKRRRGRDAGLVQIHAKQEELHQKIEGFIGMKRAEINESNKAEFLQQAQPDSSGDTSTSARVDASTLRRNIQIKTSVVVNEEGPLVRATHAEEEEHVDVSGIEERLGNLEDLLRIAPGKPIPRDVYLRIKVLEDKVVEMEKETSRLVSLGVIPNSSQPFIVRPTFFLCFFPDFANRTLFPLGLPAVPNCQEARRKRCLGLTADLNTRYPLFCFFDRKRKSFFFVCDNGGKGYR